MTETQFWPCLLQAQLQNMPRESIPNHNDASAFSEEKQIGQGDAGLSSSLRIHLVRLG